MMKLDRNTLKIIRNMAYDLATHSGMAPNWKQAYIELSNAADRLDAMLARNKEVERTTCELPPTIPWDPDNSIVFVSEEPNNPVPIEDRVVDYFVTFRKFQPSWFQVLDLRQEVYERAIKLADQISTSPCRLSFEVIDRESAKIRIKFSSRSSLEALPLTVIPPARKSFEQTYHVRVVKLILEDDGS